MASHGLSHPVHAAAGVGVARAVAVDGAPQPHAHDASLAHVADAPTTRAGEVQGYLANKKTPPPPRTAT